eukprot:1330440-Amphidinium_carterae.2
MSPAIFKDALRRCNGNRGLYECPLILSCKEHASLCEPDVSITYASGTMDANTVGKDLAGDSAKEASSRMTAKRKCRGWKKRSH